VPLFAGAVEPKMARLEALWLVLELIVLAVLAKGNFGVPLGVDVREL
jgi:hypothetical protein